MELVNRWVIPICHECGEAWDKARLTQAHEAEQGRIERLFSMADFGTRYRNATFDNFEDRPGTEIMKIESLAFVDDWPKVHGLALIGTEGSGKTHCAAAICNEMRGKIGCVMRSVPELLAALRECINKKRSAMDKLEALIEADLLILDDLGAEKVSDWVQEQLFMLVDKRYRAEKPIIITSNLPLGELEERIGQRTIARLIEMCRIVPVDATSYRLEKAKARAH